jgi:hypothetical protein
MVAEQELPGLGLEVADPSGGQFVRPRPGGVVDLQKVVQPPECPGVAQQRLDLADRRQVGFEKMLGREANGFDVDEGAEVVGEPFQFRPPVEHGPDARDVLLDVIRGMHGRRIVLEPLRVARRDGRSHQGPMGVTEALEMPPPLLLGPIGAMPLQPRREPLHQLGDRRARRRRG